MSKEIKDLLKESGDIPVNIEGYMQYYAIESQVKILLGKVLTIIDSSIPQEKQNKAIKDLIKDKFYGQLSWIKELVGYEATPSTLSSVDN